MGFYIVICKVNSQWYLPICSTCSSDPFVIFKLFLLPLPLSGFRNYPFDNYEYYLFMKSMILFYSYDILSYNFNTVMFCFVDAMRYITFLTVHESILV